MKNTIQLMMNTMKNDDYGGLLKMKIYEKLALIQKNLMSMKLPKSGYNSFRKFHYYELEDILPAIFQECYKQELFMEFTFTNELAQLKIRNWNEPGESVITSVPVQK